MKNATFRYPSEPVYLFEPDPELHPGTERASFSNKFRRPGLEPSVLSVNLAGSGPVMFFIDSRTRLPSCHLRE